MANMLDSLCYKHFILKRLRLTQETIQTYLELFWRTFDTNIWFEQNKTKNENKTKNKQVFDSATTPVNVETFIRIIECLTQSLMSDKFSFYWCFIRITFCFHFSFHFFLLSFYFAILLSVCVSIYPVPRNRSLFG